jgi:hypothetical protein
VILRRPLVVVLALLLLSGTAFGAVRAVDHVLDGRRAAAEARELERAWAAKEPQRQAVRNIGLPAGFTPCPQFPNAMRDWGEICWQATGSPVDATVQARRVLRLRGVTDLTARCEQREPGWELCHLQGLLDGYRLGLAITREDHSTVNGLKLHGTLVHGAIDLFWHDKPAAATAGWTEVTIPAG